MKKNPLPIGALQDKLEALPNANKALVVILTLGLIVGAFYFLLYQDQAKKIKSLSGDVSGKQKKLAELKQASQQVDVLQKELAVLNVEYEKAKTLLPDQKEIPALLDTISVLGAETGLVNILFQPQPEVNREFYAEIPIKLDLRGTYHDTAVFLDRISKLPRILRADNLSISRVSEKGPEAQGGTPVLVSCTLMTYRFVEKPPEPAPPATKGKAPPPAKKK